MRVATRVTGDISGVGDVSLMRVDVGTKIVRRWMIVVDVVRHSVPGRCYVGLMQAGTVCLLHVARRSM